MFKGLSDMKKSLDNSRTREPAHELAPVIFQSKYMLNPIDQSSDFEFNSEKEKHRKNTFSFMNEQTNINKML